MHKSVLTGVMLAGCLSIAGCSRGEKSTTEGTATPVEEPRSAPSAAPGATLPPSSTPLQAKKPMPPPVPRMTLEQGAKLAVRTTTTLSSKTSQTGETFTATLEEPIVEGATVFAPKGSKVEGTVVESDQGGRVKGVAGISVRLARLYLPNGSVVDLQTSPVARRARTTKKKDATKVGVGAGIGAAIGAIAGGGRGAAVGAAVGGGAGTGAVLATRGDAAVIPAESILTFTLAEPVALIGK
ncbi:MAG: hypothetical protein WD696_13625 [Bryobacteraceae bacterium]